MSEAPERIWAQDAEPSECHYIGGGWWDEECGTVQYPHIVEYIRADHVDTLLKAEREKTLREAAEVAGVKPRRGGKPVSGPHHAGLRDGREEAKRLVLALISKDKSDA